MSWTPQPYPGDFGRDPLCRAGEFVVSGCDDRERVYLRLGAPDEVGRPDDHPRPPEEGEGDGFPFEVWHYSHLDGIGDNVSLEFVDTELSGNYKLVLNPDNAAIREALFAED